MSRRLLSTILEATGVLLVAFFVGACFGWLFAVPVVGAYLVLVSVVIDRSDF